MSQLNYATHFINTHKVKPITMDSMAFNMKLVYSLLTVLTRAKQCGVHVAPVAKQMLSWPR